MNIALLQMQPHPAAPDLNFARIASAARAAQAFGAQLLVTPELSLTGYALGNDIGRLAEPRDGPLIMRLLQLARATDLAIVAGFPERDGGAVYNSAVMVSANGVECYRKCHLFGPVERAQFSASDAAPRVFDVAGVKAGLLICYDIEFPEMARGLALAGVDLVIVPTALPASPGNAGSAKCWCRAARSRITCSSPTRACAAPSAICTTQAAR
jgi:predicted amidohydrolase